MSSQDPRLDLSGSDPEGMLPRSSSSPIPLPAIAPAKIPVSKEDYTWPPEPADSSGHTAPRPPKP